jgi:hypothetical protein
VILFIGGPFFFAADTGEYLLRKLMNNVIHRLLVLGVLIFLIGTARAADLTLYVKPTGDNQASGMREDEAVASLQVAVEKAFLQTIQGMSKRKIVIFPGNYLEQTIVVGDIPNEKPLVISGLIRSGLRPIFDGHGSSKGRSWLALESSSGKPSRLTIENIEVVNYVTAISLNGQRGSINASNSENIIRNNIFRNIGQISFPTGKPSTAAVRLVNSRGNQIIENQFINIRNNVGCGALHSIYIAHYSSDNLIEGNIFDGGCGATIKTRDTSGSNMIRGNRFLDQSEPVFLDSFCDKDSREDCTKETSECPSWGNEFKDNSMAGLGPKATRTPVRVSGAGFPSGCPQPPARATRVIESNNQVVR